MLFKNYVFLFIDIKVRKIDKFIWYRWSMQVLLTWNLHPPPLIQLKSIKKNYVWLYMQLDRR